MKTAEEIDLAWLVQHTTNEVQQAFKQVIATIPAPNLKSAMRYMMANPGKCLRPLLIYATGHIFSSNLANCVVPACAVELMHTYSLIHDDLPCMDNADLRRNHPTCHKVYGDAVAVLAGDALQTQAIQVLATYPANISAANRLAMIETLSIAAGPYGMVAGQALDIQQDHVADPDQLLYIYHLKTGMLFSACVELGRLCQDDHDPVNKESLAIFSNNIGLAFQIQDDILDVEKSTAELGKSQNMDQMNQKTTYPALVGMDQAKQKVAELYTAAQLALSHFGHDARLLRALTDNMLNRQN